MSFTRVTSFGSNDSGYESGESADIIEAHSRAKQQEHAREVSRQRQSILAKELSRQDSDEYGQDMLEHMLRMDAESLPDVDSIDIQTEIQWFMRPYLLDFLVEAHSAFQLLPETLFLTINLLDRYCSKRVVYKRHYQLVGCAALLIAAKYGDKKEKVPTIKELKSMCCSLYDDDMFLQMEWHVLSTLGWSIGHPTADAFLKMAMKDSVPDPEVESLTLYILEIALYHREFVSRHSSSLALSALALARDIYRRPQIRQVDWAHQYDRTIFADLSAKLGEPSNILSRKYSSARHFNVSSVVSSYVMHKAMMARAPPTPVYDLTPPAFSKGNSTGYFNAFSTPQKNQVTAVSAHGLYTPPITPDEGVPKHAFMPPTPTPTGPQQFEFTGLPQYHNGSQWNFGAY
ncbi:G1/S-specific cyclin CCN1 [Cyphellophora attinorum]|uniref:G1/S-specific cyclin CCN1 n=1 Tax=Cyphellophora attinorum TaxID=1664694 RepID=A0A0N1I1F3_9EURO|nr:G1/S-specific cyclin CCN1 [Phialophora attinorum]KPI45674.1 G1/S-specific cyclin CCN1 [Phialophora attinorum]